MLDVFTGYGTRKHTVLCTVLGKNLILCVAEKTKPALVDVIYLSLYTRHNP